MRALVDAIEAEAFGPIRHILHIGIGGSALGPDFLIDALGRDSGRYDTAVVSNVDGAALEEAVAGFDPHTTLLVVASKTFTTLETLLNARSALAWMEQGGVADPYGRVVALTAAPERAIEFGVDETRILPFAESVGGRYSLWSSIGFPAALALGWEAFETLLEGAAAMDRHFRLAPPARERPCPRRLRRPLLRQRPRRRTRAVFAYDERLRLLPSYLQQLEMESNGKSVRLDGAPAGARDRRRSSGAGSAPTPSTPSSSCSTRAPTSCRSSSSPAVEPGHALRRGASPPAADQLLRPGRGPDVRQARATIRTAPIPATARRRPSSSTASTRPTLGALIAFYEHRTFANAVLLGINPFDQFGVELGKAMAKAIDSGDELDFDPSTRALIDAALGERSIGVTLKDGRCGSSSTCSTGSPPSTPSAPTNR